jgi:hypothetical protein
MSILHFWVLAGASTGNGILMKYRHGEKMPAETRFQVLLSHGGNIMVDEQYFFENETDARWFINGGFRTQLYENETAPDHLELLIDGLAK